MRLRLGISFSSHIFYIYMGISISPHKSLVLLRIRLHPVLLTFCSNKFTPCKGTRKPEKFSLWNPESRVLESAIQLMESGIPLTIGIQNPSSTDKDWNPVPGIWNPQRGIQNPRLSWIPSHEVNKCRVLATSLLKCSNLGKGI